jgi:ATP-binding cassette, subfamily B, bacterial PglK
MSIPRRRRKKEPPRFVFLNDSEDCDKLSVAMSDAVLKCWKLLPRKFQWAVAGLFLLMNLTAVAQLGMVASILPFLQAIADQEALIESRFAGELFRWTGPMEGSTLLMVLGLVVIAAVVLANAISATHTILVTRFAAKLDCYLSTLLLRSYLMRPYLFYLNRNTSEFLRNIFSEIFLVTGGFLQTTMSAITLLLTILGLSVLLVVVNPWVAFGAGFFFAGSYTVIYFALRARIKEAGRRRAEADELRYKAVCEAFGTIKELKVLRREDHFIEAFERPSRRFFHYEERAQLYSSLPRNLVEVIAFAGMVMVALLILQQHDGLSGALPVLGLFAVAGYRLMPAIQGLYRCCSQLRYYRESVDTVYRECEPLLQTGDSVHSGDILPETKVGQNPRLRLKEAIELDGVSFKYPNSARHAVENVTLRIPARARIGFCGRSGSGKTTLVDIILGLLQPQAGTVRVDGAVIDEKNSAQWQRNCGYVPQQIYLTDDTIRNNIAFGIPPEEVDDDLVRNAARLANIDTFIEAELSDGYDTRVGEDGIRLSGGQRQRIGIARALYHDPEVIVLDEATSSLDAETERAIVEAVESLSGRKTILMIAHRVSTIRHSDLVVFVDNGAVTATGPFEELLTSTPRFHQLAEA